MYMAINGHKYSHFSLPGLTGAAYDHRQSVCKKSKAGSSYTLIVACIHESELLNVYGAVCASPNTSHLCSGKVYTVFYTCSH